jgi:ribosomal protein S18 acetylase RimI-like enzyme
MVAVRALHWPADRSALLALDTSFVTDRVYQLVQTEQAFELKTVAVTPSLRKDYQFTHDVDNLPAFDRVLVAEIDVTLTGVAALKLEAWNRRAVLWHFYVAPAYRGRGIGRILMDSVIEAAHTLDARCLWLETQNINYGAIRFYKQVGFQWCGLDTSLYDQQDSPTQEIALFFVRALPRCSP